MASATRGSRGHDSLHGPTHAQHRHTGDDAGHASHGLEFAGRQICGPGWGPDHALLQALSMGVDVARALRQASRGFGLFIYRTALEIVAGEQSHSMRVI